MRILGITSPQSGVGYHRIIMPVAHMQKEYAMLTDTVTDQIVDNNYDIFLMNRYFTGVDIAQVLEMRKKYGFKLVVDNDDFWKLDAFHVLYNRYADGDITNKIVITGTVGTTVGTYTLTYTVTDSGGLSASTTREVVVENGGGGGPTGGAGGSGVVVISYAGSQRGTGGTVTTSGGNTIHTFTSSGTYTA